MFERILVVLESADIEQDLCQAALKLAEETGARVHWMQLLQPQDSIDFGPLRFLHQQARLMYGIESDITLISGVLTLNGKSMNSIREQLVKWEPDLLMIGQNYFKEIIPLLTDKQHPGGSACSVMLVPNSDEAHPYPSSPLPTPFELPQLIYTKETVKV
jgi:hypothetical protein